MWAYSSRRITLPRIWKLVKPSDPEKNLRDLLSVLLGDKSVRGLLLGT